MDSGPPQLEAGEAANLSGFGSVEKDTFTSGVGLTQSVQHCGVEYSDRVVHTYFCKERRA
jgi:hypothetical protein